MLVVRSVAVVPDQLHEPALASVVVDDRDAAAGGQVALQAPEVGGPVLDVVVRVRREHQGRNPREQE